MSKQYLIILQHLPKWTYSSIYYYAILYELILVTTIFYHSVRKTSYTSKVSSQSSSEVDIHEAQRLKVANLVIWTSEDNCAYYGTIYILSL